MTPPELSGSRAFAPFLSLLFLGFAIVVFILVATTVIDTDLVRWEAGAFAAFVLSFVPWPV